MCRWAFLGEIKERQLGCHPVWLSAPGGPLTCLWAHPCLGQLFPTLFLEISIL